MNKHLRYFWLVIAFALSFFVGGRWNFPLLAWLPSIFVIRFYRDSDRAGRNFLLLWLASAIPAVISWNGATFMNFIHPTAEAAFFFLMAPIALLPYVIDRMYYRRFGSPVWLTLVYPIAATAVDFFSSNGSPFGTFGASAYSQREFLPVMQIASVTGLWGITFLIAWFASLVNHVWELGWKPSRLSLAFAGILTIILILGFGRILSPAQPERTAQIAGFSLPANGLSETMHHLQSGDEAAFRRVVDALHSEELAQIRKLADEGADIVVLQEGAGMGFTDQLAKLMSDASVIANEKNIYIVLPTVDLGKSPVENVVRIIDSNGDIVLTHVKYGGNDFEGSLKGNGVLQTVDTPYGKLSAIICWDADFPNIVRQAGVQDVDLLFIPSNDWRGVKDIHAGMSTFRAVENGMSIFRQTGEGVSLVVDAYGREHNRVDRFEENVSGFTTTQIVQTPIGSVNTLYPVLGDVVGNLTLVGLLGLLMGLWLTRKQQPAFISQKRGDPVHV